MKRFNKIRLAMASVLLVGLLASRPALAASSYQGYIYDSLNQTPLSINGYLYEDSIDGYDMQTGPFKSPEDIFVTADDTLFVVDSGNNRIIHMDRNKQVLKIYGDESSPGQLNSPKGVFVTKDGVLYVADTKNRRIALFDEKTGKFIKDFPTPKSPLLGKDFIYSPSKVIVDKRGYMFVVSEGTSQGLMQIKPDGTFAGFFGANHVGFDLGRFLIKLIATQDQKDQLAKVRPPEFSNLYQDSEGFIYTTTLGVQNNEVKRLSAVGVDTLNGDNSNIYGDYYLPRNNYQPATPACVGITVDDSGLITAIDQTTGKAFQYDKLGDLLFVFGGIGEQDGLLKTPVAINHTSDGTIYIVDRTRGRIDRFHTTPFADMVHKASALYVDGKYDEAEKPWHDVLDMNSNYDLANKAIGKALYKQERYFEAMQYFRTARDRSDYSSAFLEYRKQYMRDHFGPIAGGFLAFILIVWYGMSWSKSRKKRQQISGGLDKGGMAR